MAIAASIRPEGAAADWTIPQAWDRYTPAEHAMWDRLFERQARLLPGRVVPQFIAGLDVLRMQAPGIPHFEELSLLADPIFADCMQAYGAGGLRAEGLGAIDRLARLYWYTVEFDQVRRGVIDAG